MEHIFLIYIHCVQGKSNTGNLSLFLLCKMVNYAINSCCEFNMRNKCLFWNHGDTPLRLVINFGHYTLCDLLPSLELCLATIVHAHVGLRKLTAVKIFTQGSCRQLFLCYAWFVTNYTQCYLGRQNFWICQCHCVKGIITKF